MAQKTTESEIRKEIIEAGRILASENLLPATSGNLSMKDAENGIITITTSGKSKGQLDYNDFIEIDINANPISDSLSRPSAETLLHTQIYKFFGSATAVFHIHSINSVVISKLFADAKEVKLKNYELLKALSGIKTHQHIETVPIFRNTQNIKLLAAEVDEYMQINPEIHGYLIEGHGLYSWGTSSQEALRHIEVFETLFEIEIKLAGLKRGKEHDFSKNLS